MQVENVRMQIEFFRFVDIHAKYLFLVIIPCYRKDDVKRANKKTEKLQFDLFLMQFNSKYLKRKMDVFGSNLIECFCFRLLVAEFR